MADVKIKIKVDDSGALQTLRDFNANFKQLNNQAKRLNKNLNKTLKDVKNVGAVGRQAFTKVNDGVKKTTASSKKLKREMDGVTKAGNSIKNVFAGVFIADTLRAAIRLVARAVSGAVEEFALFEAGVTRIGKTANITGKELDDLGIALRDIDMATSNEQLLDIAATAGQLGIKGSANILKFTKVMAKLETATDVAGQSGATAIARILNVTGTATSEVDRFAASLVDLGNNSAATESEILLVGERVATATALFDVSAEDTIAFGAALKSLGIRAEAGGSSIGRLFKQIDKAVSQQGPLLENFAKTMGITGRELTDAFNEDSTNTVLRFLRGLSTEGKNATTKLNELGLSDIRVSATLGTLSKNIGEVNKSFNLSREATKDNTALNKEYEATLNDLNTIWGTTKNLVSDLGIEFTQVFAPALKGTLKLFNGLVEILKFRPFDVDPEIDLTTLDGLGNKINQVTLQIGVLEASITKVTSNKTISKDDRDSALRRINKELGEQIILQNQLNREFEQRLKQDSAISTMEARELEFLARKKEAETKRLEDLGIFGRAKIEQQKSEIELSNQLVKFGEDEQFMILADGLGAREALKITKRAEELEAQGKHQEAALLLLEKDELAKTKIKEQNNKNQKKEDAERLNGQRKLTINLLTLASSESKELAAIGKAGALIQIGIDTEQAIASAYKYGLLISGGNPGVGVAFGAIAGAAQAQRAANVLNYENGGIVPGSSFTGDNVQANVNSGEMILNKQQQSNMFNQLNSGGSNRGQEVVVHNTVELDGEVVARTVSRQVANGMVLGENL